MCCTLDGFICCLIGRVAPFFLCPISLWGLQSMNVEQVGETPTLEELFDTRKALITYQYELSSKVIPAFKLERMLSDYDGDAEYALEESQENRQAAIESLDYARVSLKNARAFMNWQIATFGGVSEAFKDSIGACVIECNKLDAMANSEAHKASLLQGLHYVAVANDAMHKRYCRAVEVSIGKRSIGTLKRWLTTQYALLDKLTNAATLASEVAAGKVSSLGAPMLLAMRRAELAHLDVVEARASMKECTPVDHELWAWVSRVKREGVSLSTGVCQLGQHEELEKLYGHAYVMHSSVGSVAVSKGEKAKAKAHYDASLHPYADTDSTLMQAYCHDETGRAVIAPFPKRPVVSVRNSKRRATLAPCLEIKAP